MPESRGRQNRHIRSEKKIIMLKEKKKKRKTIKNLKFIHCLLKFVDTQMKKITHANIVDQT